MFVDISTCLGNIKFITYWNNEQANEYAYKRRPSVFKTSLLDRYQQLVKHLARCSTVFDFLRKQKVSLRSFKTEVDRRIHWLSWELRTPWYKPRHYWPAGCSYSLLFSSQMSTKFKIVTYDASAAFISLSWTQICSFRCTVSAAISFISDMHVASPHGNHCLRRWLLILLLAIKQFVDYYVAMPTLVITSYQTCTLSFDVNTLLKKIDTH